MILWPGTKFLAATGGTGVGELHLVLVRLRGVLEGAGESNEEDNGRRGVPPAATLGEELFEDFKMPLRGSPAFPGDIGVEAGALRLELI